MKNLILLLILLPNLGVASAIGLPLSLPPGVTCETLQVNLSVASDKGATLSCGGKEIAVEKNLWVVYLNLYRWDAPKAEIALVEFQSKAMVLARKKVNLLEYESIEKFDPVIYDLSSVGKAIGLRIMTRGCGGGGSACSDVSLALFTYGERSLEEVFRSQMSYSASLGGDWKKDGSRTHHNTEKSSVLMIEKTTTGIPVLVKKLKGSKSVSQKFIWVPLKRKFETSDKSFLESVND